MYDLPERIADYHDRILIYGIQSCSIPSAEYAFPATIVPRVRYCGIVLNRDEVLTRNQDKESPIKRTRPTVLATVGGGEDGKHILGAFIAASEGASWDGIVVAGTMNAAPRSRVPCSRRGQCQYLEFHVFLSGLMKPYQQVDAAVCMGGYNTGC